MSPATAVWRARIERQQASGLPISRFCERERISTASFFTWRKRLASESTPVFLPVTVAAPVPRGTALELETTSGVVIRIFDGFRRQTLVDVLAALAGASA